MVPQRLQLEKEDIKKKINATDIYRIECSLNPSEREPMLINKTVRKYLLQPYLPHQFRLKLFFFLINLKINTILDSPFQLHKPTAQQCGWSLQLIGLDHNSPQFCAELPNNSETPSSQVLHPTLTPEQHM